MGQATLDFIALSARWAGGRKEGTVWEIANASAMGGASEDVRSGHGTQKPVEAMRRPIENSSAKGDFVYDPFVGSGTTIIAAEQAGRRCIACDIDPVYAKIALQRWVAFASGEAIEEASGESWTERLASGAPSDEDALA